MDTFDRLRLTMLRFQFWNIVNCMKYHVIHGDLLHAVLRGLLLPRWQRRSNENAQGSLVRAQVMLSKGSRENRKKMILLIKHHNKVKVSSIILSDYWFSRQPVLRVLTILDNTTRRNSKWLLPLHNLLG